MERYKIMWTELRLSNLMQLRSSNIDMKTSNSGY